MSLAALSELLQEPQELKPIFAKEKNQKHSPPLL